MDSVISSSTSGALEPTSLPTTPLAPNSSSTASLLGWVVLGSLKAVPSILYFVMALVTMTIPGWLYTLLSVSMTVTVNFSTMALIGVAFVSTASYIFRYRYHKYGRAPPDIGRKEPGIEVPHPPSDTKPGLSNYLDEFLSAIKVFGYLDRPVFHELTRTMHTRRLAAGETFLLEEEKGFCLVVEGTVQIFAKSYRDDEDSDSDSSNGEHQTHEARHGYQLLTEVKNGSSLSSLFSILSLFTEDITLKDNHRRTQSGGDARLRMSSLNMSSVTKTPTRSRPSTARFVKDPPQSRSQPSSRMPSPEIPAGHLPNIPPLSLDEQMHSALPSPSPTKHADTIPLRRSTSAHPQIVARAAEDSTIAIIPAAAFKRLTQVYPKSTAHVVQVILNRFYRVTLATAHRYLGLSQEIVQIEKRMSKLVTSEMPNIMLDHYLERLKDKFNTEKERLGTEDITKGIALHNPRISRHRRSSNTIKKELAVGARITAARVKMNGNSSRNQSPEDDRAGVSAGDLFKGRGSGSNLQTPWPRIISPTEDGAGGYFQPRPAYSQRQESIDEGTILREAILNCMCNAMGLTNSNAPTKLESVEQSPRMVSYDQKRNRAVFNTVFGLMDPFEQPIDADSESNFSLSASGVHAGQTVNVVEEIVDDVEIVYFQKGSVLVDQQERLPGLYFVIDGFLEVGMTIENDLDESNFLRTVVKSAEDLKMGDGSKNEKSRQSQSRQSLYLVKPGSLAGYLPAISGFRSFVDVRAKSDVIVGFLPRASLDRLVERYPIILLTLAKRLTSLLDRVILHIDFALEYLQVNAGQVIYEQNEESDAIYIILNGRLRAIQEQADKSIEVLGEYGQGDSVGELEVLTETKRPGSLHTIRDSEIARLPMSLFNSLAQEHPSITLKMSKVLAKRMRSLMYTPVLTSARERTAIGGVKNSSSTVNLRTVGILPVREGVPVTEFAARLANALTQIGSSVTTLNQAQIMKHLGRHAFSKMGKLKLQQYLADLEEKFDLILYVADTSVQSSWTATCISQSDCILVVAVADDSPNIGAYERALLGAKTTARKELVLLHPERYCPAGLTKKWLNKRVWINGGHHHVQIIGMRAQSQQGQLRTRRLGAAIKQRVRIFQAEIQKYTGRKMHQTPIFSPVALYKSDFHRLARRLCGKSIGLVLGGGGARGCAHVGIIRAMEEAGIPIDIIGGTSIGAFVGAVYAWDAGILPMYGRIKRFAGKMGSMWRFALDLTYPASSYTTGLEFNRGIWTTFGNYLIEDFWLPFYCNTTNISKSCAEYHNSGYVWRYVRASMSLSGLLPPLCEDGSMLLDGGYIDNLTVAHMKGLGVDVIFAVDVGSLDDTTPQTFGDSLSGFWTLFNRFNPFSSTPNPPSLGDIQSRLAYVSSVEALERAKNTQGCHYMRPPIDPFGTLSFGEFDEIYRVGYEYGKKFMADLRERNILPVMKEAEEEKSDLRRTRMIRRASI